MIARDLSVLAGVYSATPPGNRVKPSIAWRLFLTLAPSTVDPEAGAEVVPVLTGDGPKVVE